MGHVTLLALFYVTLLALFYVKNKICVTGKTQENIRNRVRITAVTDREKALKLIAKPAYKRSVKIHEDMVLFQNHISCVKLNRPIQVGFSVLELSKLHMARFHYDKMTSWFDDIQLCFTDTGE